MALIDFVRNWGVHTVTFYDPNNSIIQCIEGCSNTPWHTNNCEYCKEIAKGHIKRVASDPVDTNIYLDCKQEDLSILPFNFCQERCSR